MSARDRYTLKLLCENCGHTGEADMSENDGWSFMNGNVDRRLERLSEGLKYNSGILHKEKFICKCGNTMKHNGWGN
jgi:hypothetical protein